MTNLASYAHPFALSTNSDGTHADDGTKLGIREITSSNVYKFDLSSVEEESLHYFCEAHPNMGGEILYQCTEIYQPTPTPTETHTFYQEIPETPSPTESPSPLEDNFIVEESMFEYVPSDYTESNINELFPIIDDDPILTNENGGIASFTVNLMLPIN